MKVSATLALVALALFVPLAQAIEPAPPPPSGNVYQGYGKYEQGWWLTYQKWQVWVTVDTGADTVKVVWKGQQNLILPWLGTSYMTQMSVYDEKGWDGYELYAKTWNGEKTYYGYTNTYTWVHVHVMWTYILASPTPAFWNIHVYADVYVEG